MAFRVWRTTVLLHSTQSQSDPSVVTPCKQPQSIPYRNSALSFRREQLTPSVNAEAGLVHMHRDPLQHTFARC